MENVNGNVDMNEMFQMFMQQMTANGGNQTQNTPNPAVVPEMYSNSQEYANAQRMGNTQYTANPNNAANSMQYTANTAVANEPKMPRDVSLTVNVFPITEPLGNTMAFASVSIDNLIAIRGLRVVNGENGLFVSMPQSQDKKTNEFHDIVFPLNPELRNAITDAVLGKYAAELGINLPQRKPSLNVRITEGKKKAAAQQPATAMPAAAKSKTGTNLE